MDTSPPSLPDDWFPLFGEKEQGEKLSFLKELGEPTRKVYGSGTKSESTYVNFKPLGLSLLFENGCLDGVFLYKQGVDGYGEYKGKLPYEMSMSMNNVQIVKLLGEPAKKTPKNNVTPIWLEYTSKGITINFLYKSYDELNNPITSVAIFPPPPKI
jgi:hypothetical protein